VDAGACRDRTSPDTLSYLAGFCNTAAARVRPRRTRRPRWTIS